MCKNRNNICIAQIIYNKIQYFNIHNVLIIYYFIVTNVLNTIKYIVVWFTFYIFAVQFGRELHFKMAFLKRFYTSFQHKAMPCKELDLFARHFLMRTYEVQSVPILFALTKQYTKRLSQVRYILSRKSCSVQTTTTGTHT